MRRTVTTVLMLSWLAAPLSAAAQTATAQAPWRTIERDPAAPADAPWRSAPDLGGAQNAPWRDTALVSDSDAGLGPPAPAPIALEGETALVAHVERDGSLPFTRTSGKRIGVGSLDSAAGFLAVVAINTIVDIAEARDSRRLADAYDLKDPSNQIAAGLAAHMAVDRGGTIAAAPVHDNPADPSNKGAILRQARFVIDVRSGGAMIAGEDATSFRSHAALRDMTSGKVSILKCSTKQYGEKPRGGRLSDEQRIKTALRAGANYCLADLKTKIDRLNIGERPKAQPAVKKARARQVTKATFTAAPTP